MVFSCHTMKFHNRDLTNVLLQKKRKFNENLNIRRNLTLQILKKKMKPLRLRKVNNAAPSQESGHLLVQRLREIIKLFPLIDITGQVFSLTSSAAKSFSPSRTTLPSSFFSLLVNLQVRSADRYALQEHKLGRPKAGSGLWQSHWLKQPKNNLRYNF